jgi:hypothetical protein
MVELQWRGTGQLNTMTETESDTGAMSVDDTRGAWTCSRSSAPRPLTSLISGFSCHRRIILSTSTIDCLMMLHTRHDTRTDNEAHQDVSGECGQTAPFERIECH